MTLPSDTDLRQSRTIAELAWALEAAGRVWAIMPESLVGLQHLLRDRASVEGLIDRLQPLAESKEAGPRKPGRPPKVKGGVEVVALEGPLMPGMSLMELIFGIESGLSGFQSAFSRAAGDPDVGAIVMNIDSPGGLVDGIPETAAMISEVAKHKPVTAVANTLAASAAYWLASQANEIVVTPSGEVGSIGVYTTHWDASKQLAMDGIEPTLVSAGKYKTEGNPYGPLGTEAEAYLQQSVDDYYDMFVKDVASGRNASVKAVKSGFGEGRVLTAKRSVDAGLADRVETLGSVVAGLQRRSTGSPERAAADAVEVEYTAEERERLVGMAGTLDFSRTTREGLPA